MTRAEALDTAARLLATMRARRDAMSPEDAAAAAHRPDGMSLAERVALIRAHRAEAAQQQLDAA